MGRPWPIYGKEEEDALDPSEVVQRVVRGKKDLEFSTREEAADYSERLGRRFLQKVLADVM